MERFKNVNDFKVFCEGAFWMEVFGFCGSLESDYAFFNVEIINQTQIKIFIDQAISGEDIDCVKIDSAVLSLNDKPKVIFSSICDLVASYCDINDYAELETESYDERD